MKKLLFVIVMLGMFGCYQDNDRTQQTQQEMKKIDRVALVAAGIKKGDAEYRIAKSEETGEDHVVLVRSLPSGRYEILEDLGTIE